MYKTNNLGFKVSPLLNARFSFLLGRVLSVNLLKSGQTQFFPQRVGLYCRGDICNIWHLSIYFFVIPSLPYPFPCLIKYKLTPLCGTFFFYLRKGIIFEVIHCMLTHPPPTKGLKMTEYHEKHIFKTFSNVLTCNIMFSPPT